MNNKVKHIIQLVKECRKLNEEIDSLDDYKKLINNIKNQNAKRTQL